MIAARGLTAGYDGQVVLRNLTFAPRPGTVTALIGPNGAGKSTLLRVLAGLLRPSRGDVMLGGRIVGAELTPAELSRTIALAPQEEAADLPLTVREDVALGRTPYLGRFGWMTKRDHRAVELALRTMDLTRLADRELKALSGGERKRVVIARTLAQEAKVHLFDEPTAHLDPAHADQTWKLLRGMAGWGATVVVATHDLWRLSRRVHAVALLANGRLILQGRPKAVLRSAAARRAFGTALPAG